MSLRINDSCAVAEGSVLFRDRVVHLSLPARIHCQLAVLRVFLARRLLILALLLVVIPWHDCLGVAYALVPISVGHVAVFSLCFRAVNRRAEIPYDFRAHCVLVSDEYSKSTGSLIAQHLFYS